VDKQKKFSERLNAIVMDLVEGSGRTATAEALGVPANFFSPSKYGPDKFATKSIGHLDELEEYFGIDLLGGSGSALAREIDRAEKEGALTQHDRSAILSMVRAAREHATLRLRGEAAVEKVKALKNKQRKSR
jgi:hypothetical protein